MDDDDERDRLLSALQTKLAELDAQVAAFRRARADDFRRYAALLISNVPPALAADVSRSFNQQATKLRQGALYPSLLCEGDDNDTTADTPTDTTTSTTTNTTAASTGTPIASAAIAAATLPSPSSPSSPASPFLPPPTLEATPASSAPPASSSSSASALVLAAAAAPPTVSRRPASPPPAVNQMPGTPMRVLSPAILPLSPTRMPILASSPSSRGRIDDFSGVFTPPFLPLLEAAAAAYPRSYSSKSSQVVSALLSPSLSPSPSLSLDGLSTTIEPIQSRETAVAIATPVATPTPSTATPATPATPATTATPTTPATTATAAAAETTETTAADTKTMSTDTMPPPYSAFSPFAAPSPPLPLSSVPPQTPKRPQLKSVLRWSSGSISPATPRSSQERRVRFSFDGKEVLPTSSPPRQFDHDLSWLRPSHHIVDGFLDPDDDDPEIDMGNFHESEFRFDVNAGGPSGTAAAPAAASGRPGPIATAPSSSSPPLASPTPLTRTPAMADDEPLSPTSAGPLLLANQEASSSYFGSVDSAANDDPFSGLSEPPLRRRSEPSLGSGDLDRHYEHPAGAGASDSNSSPQHHRRRHSLILDDGDLNAMPLSRRMSSSDRLRALSKVPLEDPSMWTVVDPHSDPTAGPADASSFVPVPRPDLVARKALVSMAEEDEEDDAHDDTYGNGGDDDEDAFISMRPARRESADSGSSVTRPTATTEENTTTATADNAQTATAYTRHEEEEADDPFFEFDDEEAGEMLGYPLARVSNTRPYVSADEDEDEDVDDIELEDASDRNGNSAIDGTNGVDIPISKDEFAVGADDNNDDTTRDAEKVFGSLAFVGPDGTGKVVQNGSPRTPRPAPPSRLSSSLSSSISASRPIPAPLSPTTAPGAAADPTLGPLSPTTMATSVVGSYRGRPLAMFNVVKDPRILEEVAQLGEFSSFVGGVDGRTGVDDDESGVPIGAPRDFLGSYRGRDLTSKGLGLSGTPRSLSERMAMEEAFKMR